MTAEHRAAVAFAQGALVAAVSQVAAHPLDVAVASLPGLGWLAPGVRVLVPVAGLALAGAMGGQAIGGRWGTGFAAGGGVIGLLLLPAAPQLQGLTGFEPPLIVASFASVTSAAAFGIGGVVASLVARRGLALRAGLAWALAGAVGGLLGVSPFLVGRWWPGAADGAVGQILWLACSLAALVVPLAAAGAWTARHAHPAQDDAFPRARRPNLV